MGNKSGSDNKTGKSGKSPASAKAHTTSSTSSASSGATGSDINKPKKQVLKELHQKNKSLTNDEKEARIKFLFNKYDTDSSGELDMNEFKLFAKDWFDEIFNDGTLAFEEFWEDVQLEVDLDGNGTISLNEFIQWLR